MSLYTREALPDVVRENVGDATLLKCADKQHTTPGDATVPLCADRRPGTQVPGCLPPVPPSSLLYVELP